MPDQNGEYDLFANVGMAGGDFQSSLTDLLTSTGLLQNKWLAVGGAVGALSAGILACIGQASDFEKKMANVKTIIGPDQETVFGKMQDDLKGMSLSLPVARDDLADVLYDIVGLGIPASDAMNVLRTSAETAVAGFTMVGPVLDTFSAIIQEYGLSWDDIKTISDKLFYTTKIGAATIEGLSASAGQIVPFAKAAGITLDEVLAAMAVLPKSQSQQGEAATQLRSAINSLISPSETLAKIYRDTFNVANGQEFIQNQGGLLGALQALKTHADGSNIDLGKLLGRQEAMLAFFKLTGESADNYTAALNGMAKATGETDAALATQLETSASQWTIIKNKFSEIMLDIGNMALPGVGAIGGGLSMLGDGLKLALDNLKILDQFITGWTVAYFKNASNVLSDFGKSVGDAWDWLGEMAGFKTVDLNDTIKFDKQKIDDVIASYGEFKKGFEIPPNFNGMVDATGKVNTAIVNLNSTHKNAIANQTSLNSAQKKYLDEIHPGFKQALVDVTYELGQLGKSAPLGIDEFLSIKESKKSWEELPPIIEVATRDTKLQADAERAAKEMAEQHKDQWNKIAGYIGNAIQLLPGMTSETQLAVRGIESAVSKFASGDVLGGIMTSITTAVTFFKNQADEANKKEVQTFGAYSKEYGKLVEDINGMTDLNKDGIQALIDNFEALEQSGKYNRQELIPILRDTIREISNLVTQQGLAADATQKVTDNFDASADAYKEMRDAMVDDPFFQNMPTPAPSGGGLHGGGFPVAHSGYLAPNEVNVRMLKNEIVLRPEATQKFGGGALLNFNRTLDPAALGGGSRPMNVIIHNANPETYVELSDRVIEPRINYRSRKMQVKANPYA